MRFKRGVSGWRPWQGPVTDATKPVAEATCRAPWPPCLAPTETQVPEWPPTQKRMTTTFL